MRSAWLALLVSGCVWVDRGSYEADIQDVDGDGVIAERFGGTDCDDSDAAIGDCDADGDGFRSLAGGGEDCDDTTAAVNPEAPEVCDGLDNDCDSQIDLFDEDAEGFLTYYEDVDQDGFGDPNKPVPSCSEEPAPGTARAGDDCLDDDPDVGATRIWFVDEDGDGYGSDLEVLGACEPAAGEAALGGDCNDDDDSIFPGANDPAYDGIDADCAGDNDYDLDGDTVAGGLGNDCDDLNPDISPLADERCDGIDNDCDGLVDDEDELEDPTAIPWSLDSDGDGYGVAVFKLFCAATGQPDGYVADATDCNDDDAGVHPTAAETCDGRDEDCDGTADNGAEGTTQLYSDADGDGYGNPLSPVAACAPYPGVVADNTDCNDANADENPGLDELDYCGDLIRNDCSTEFGPRDCDSDGLEDSNFGGTDCDDLDPLAGNSPEICDGSDNDCDGFIDQADPDVDLSTAQTYYEDDDGDGHGNPSIEYPGECTPPPGTVALSDDCDDDNSEASPTTEELCDGIDNDCDGTIDEPSALDARTWYADDDGDGFGTLANTRFACDQPAGYAPNADDCNDTDPYESPGELEVCDTVDNNCDGLVDDAEGTPLGAPAWYLDDDGDGIGLTSQITYSCAQPAGYVVQGGDCDDSDASVLESRNFYPDLDFDGYGDENAAAVGACTAPVNHVINNLDCDDAAPTVSPEATEVCGDTVDNDCNGQIDEAGAGGTSYWPDIDQDGFGDFFATPAVACTAPVNAVANNQDCDDLDSSVVDTFWGPDADGDGFAPEGLPTVASCVAPLQGTWSNDLSDCDDGDASRAPDLPEVCDGSNKDEDCDGLSDDDDPSVDPLGFDPSPQFEDLDGDGFGGNQIFACEVTGVPSPGDCDDTDSEIGGMFPVFADGDGDGFGTNTDPYGTLQCFVGVLESAVNTDCDDGNPGVSPGRVELCDDLNVDEDCNGSTVGQPNRGFDLVVGTDVATLPEAVDGACAGDTLLIPYGTYSVNLTMDEPGVRLLGVPNEQGLLPELVPLISSEPIVAASESIDLEELNVLGLGSLDAGVPLLRFDEGAYLGGVDLDGDGSSPGIWVLGGLLYLSNSKVTFGDTTGVGGGIFATGGANVYGDEGCQISDNHANGAGGGIFAALNSQVDLNDCLVDNNVSSTAGGGIYMEGGRLDIDRSVITNNLVINGVGGALYVLPGDTSGGEVDDTFFAFNHADAAGALYVDSPGFFLTDSVVEGNTGVSGVGAVESHGSSFHVQRNHFTANESANGTVASALATSGSNTLVEDTLFEGHTLFTNVLASFGSGVTLDRVTSIDNEGSMVLQGGSLNGFDLLFVRSGRASGASLEATGGTMNVSYSIFAQSPGAGLDVGGDMFATVDETTLLSNGVSSNVGLYPGNLLILDDPTLSGCGQSAHCDATWTAFGEFQTYHPDLPFELWNLTPRHDFEPAWAGHGYYGSEWLEGSYNMDLDGDYLLDGWEQLMFGSTTVYDSYDDPDGDLLDNAAEHAAGTHADMADTDGDTHNDFYDLFPLDPNNH